MEEFHELNQLNSSRTLMIFSGIIYHFFFSGGLIKYKTKSMARIKLMAACRDAIDLELIKWYLKDMNCLVFFARTGEEALDSLMHNPDIDLILLDISLPGPDGRDLSSAIKSQNNYIVVIGITAYPLNYISSQKGVMGVDYWIQKPYGKEVVMNLMVAALLRRA